MWSGAGHGIRAELLKTPAGFIAREPGGRPDICSGAISSSLGCQCFKAGDDVEELLVDAILAQSMERAIEVL